jgi:hypothetical protein
VAPVNAVAELLHDLERTGQQKEADRILAAIEREQRRAAP